MVELLSRKRQVAITEESVAGVFNGSSDPAWDTMGIDLDDDTEAKTVAEFLFGTASWAPTSLMFDREIVNPSLTPIASFAPGVVSVELRFTMEMSGHVDNFTGSGAWSGNEPAYARLLSFCGWESQVTSIVPIASFDSGTVIKPSEFMFQVSGTDVWIAHGGAISGLDTDIAGELVTGIPISPEQFDGEDSNTRITVGTGTLNQSWTIRPLSEPDEWKTASIVYYIDGKRVKIKGARGTPELIYEHGRPPRISFQFLGILHESVDGALLTGANRPLIATHDPASYLGVGMQLHDYTAAYTVVHNAMNISQNNELVLRESSGDSDGWSFAGISNRRFTGSFSIDEQDNLDHDFQDDFETGQTTAIRFTIGNSAGNIFDVRIPSIQYTSLSESDRDSITTWDAEFVMSGRSFATQGSNEETFGADDEVTIINR